MKQIMKANDMIMQYIGKPKKAAADYRFSHYVITETVEEGFLLLNNLTRELLFLTDEEYKDAVQNEALREKWFVVPAELNEKQIMNMVRWVYKMRKKPSDSINNFVVYTTTDCNARCFYCFELGRKRVPMSDEVALKTADFIIEHCKDNPVAINWFGGEPFYNTRPMDLICSKLKDAGINYKSRTITNGYLLNEENAAKCTDLWNLKRVQISMDGTEAVYNKAKRYIYKEGNPYHIVMSNIQRLLDRNICVIIRFNLDFHNVEDLNLFAEELAQRFGGHKKFVVYTHLIIDEKKAWDEHRSLEQWNALYQAKADLDQKMSDLGIHANRAMRLSGELRTAACMADSDNSIVVTPDGSLGVCEHFSETELIGHLDSPDRDQTVVNSFREHWAEIGECDTCALYPVCIRLKKCPYIMPCIEASRKDTLITIKHTMRNEYRRWKKKHYAQDDDDIIHPDDLI